jgi:hypothetical protein
MAFEHISMTDVESSNLSAVGFDPVSRVLLVRFTNGNTYAYHGATEEEYHGLCSAESPGRYLHQTIKAKYGAERLP